MRILLLTHTFNSLAQRLHIELRQWGHEVSVLLDVNDAQTEAAVQRIGPELILAPFLKRAIPASVWQPYCCIIVHPGIVGDRGPSSLDWALLNREPTWGVTCLQAVAEMDAGPVWSCVEFPMRPAKKSSLYRKEVTEAAVLAVKRMLEGVSSKDAPTPQEVYPAALRGRWRAQMTRQERQIHWQKDTTEDVLRKIQSGDGVPGVYAELFGEGFYLYNASPAQGLTEWGPATPGSVLAMRGPSICVRTRDAGVWIGHLRIADSKDQAPSFKLPARLLLEEHYPERLAAVPVLDERIVRADFPLPVLFPPEGLELGWVIDGQIGYLYFEFYNGAMSTRQCRALLAAYQQLCLQEVSIVVLMGGEEFWSNGIHLSVIESAQSPAEESWQNIEAMNDLCEAIIQTTDKITVAALRGNAGAGGVFLSLTCDRIYAKSGCVLNPHYKGMGNLYGSEYWTYLLPKRVGEQKAQAITRACLPMGLREAQALGLIDGVLGDEDDRFLQALQREIRGWSAEQRQSWMAEKQRQRVEDEALKPLAQYRAEELEKMRLNFFGFDPSYHFARYHFVEKTPKARTPSYLAAPITISPWGQDF